MAAFQNFRGAINGFNREDAVVGGLLCFAQTKIRADALKDRDRSSDVASGAVADLDDVFSLGLKGEVLVEGSDAVDAYLAHSQLLCKMGEYLLGKISVMLLDILKDGDDRLLTAFVGGEYLVHNAEIKGCAHNFLLKLAQSFCAKFICA